VQCTFPPGKAAHDAPWIDLLEPTEAEVAAMSAAHGIRIPSRAMLEEIETSSRLQVQDDAIVATMPITSGPEHGPPVRRPLGLILTQDLFVTVRYGEVHGITRARAALADSKGDVTSVAAFMCVLEGMVDYAADELERLGAMLNDASQRIFQQPDTQSPRANFALKAMLRAVGRVGERLSHIRESLLALERIAPFVAGKAKPWLGSREQGRLDILEQDAKSLAEFEVHLTDKTQFLLDAVLGFISTEQNDIFRVLTIVSVLGIPPTFIASMYGMNFDTIHEYHWRHGYLWALSLIFLSILLPAWWFKRRGWF